MFDKTKAKEKEKRAALVTQAEAILNEERDFSPEDQKLIDELKEKIDGIDAKLDAMAGVEEKEGEEEEENTASADRSLAHPAVVRSRGRVTATDINDHAKREKYSLVRAALAVNSGRQLEGIEREVDQELRRTDTCRGQFLMPGGDWNRLNRRSDLTLTTGAGSVPTYWEGFIDFLYNQMVGPQLGFTYMTGLQAGTKIPRQTTVPTIQAVAEQGAATGSSPNIDNISLVPHTVTGNVTISRKFAMQSTVSADTYVQNALARQIGVTIDAYALSGDGASNRPTGLLNNTAFTQSVAATTNTVSYANVLLCEQRVAEANAVGNLAWVTSPAGFSKLRQQPKLGTTFPSFLIDDNGQMNGQKVVRSNQVPTNLTLTSFTGLTAAVFGAWQYLVLATFGSGSLDVIVDPYTGSKANDLIISAFIDVDTNLEIPNAFCGILNIA